MKIECMNCHYDMFCTTYMLKSRYAIICITRLDKHTLFLNFLKEMTQVNSAVRNVFIFHYIQLPWAIDDPTLKKRKMIEIRNLGSCDIHSSTTTLYLLHT